MGFKSILFGTYDDWGIGNAPPEPACFADLNLDQVVTWLTRGREGYGLEPFFHLPVSDPALIRYRQAVMRDVAQPGIFQALKRFSAAMGQRHRELGQAAAMSHPLQAQRWRLDAAASYRRAVSELHADLQTLELDSEGLTGFRDYLAGYVDSAAFADFCHAMDGVCAALDAVEYAVVIDDDSAEVRAFEGEPDQQAAIEAAFAVLREDTASPTEPEDRRHTLGVTSLEGQILEAVADLFPAAFERLDAFCADYGDYLDEPLARFEREIPFYLAYAELMARLEAAGLPWCFPVLTTAKGELRAQGAYDLALAGKLAGTEEPVVTNDFRFDGDERILVVSGPNQGGKTTFARSVGQLHYLAALGLPVPAREARLLHVDCVLTHFDREEAIAEEQGRLAADLERTRAILATAGSRSLVILNELFQSTQAGDAAELTRRVLAALRQRDALAVCVTFVEEVITDDTGVVSMVSTRDPEAAAGGDFRVERRPPEARAQADTMAARHGLTPGALARRLRS